VRLPLLIVFLLASVGCPKAGSQASGEQEPVVVEAPKSRFSGAAKAFVDGLLTLGVQGFEAASDGASVVWDELTFAEDGGFVANASVRLGDEPFTCTETGTWSLDADHSDPTAGAINFDMNETDCAGREAPQSFRVLATRAGDDIALAHR